MPSDLFGALAASYAAAGLDASAAPLHAERAPADATPPHVVATLEAGRPVFQSAEVQVDECRLTLRCRASTVAGARAIAQAIDAWMVPDGPEGRRFSWTGGAASAMARAGWSKAEEKHLARGSVPVFLDTLTYTFKATGVR
jgi:hypothetical protein